MIAITFAYVVIGISAVVFIAVFLYWLFIARPTDKQVREDEEKKKKHFYNDIRTF